MKINQVLVEATHATVAFAFGRFNPAHQGHIEVWRAVEEAGANWFIGTNPTTVGPNDPLTFQQKSAWMEEIYPPLAGHIVAQTSVLTLATYIFNKLRKNENAKIAYITDATDWAWSGKLLNQYNGQEGAHGYYKFADIIHVPSPRVSSATDLRNAARADDKVAFYHASGTDPKAKVAGKTYFDTVKEACAKYPLPVKRGQKIKEQGVAEDQLDEIFNPSSFMANFIRAASNFANDFIPAGLGALGTFAATTAVLGPVAGALAGSTVGNQVFQTLQNQQNKVPGMIQQLVQKYFGSEVEALEFAVLHAKAAFLDKPEFRWRGKQWPVSLKKNDAEAIIEKNDKYWLEQHTQQQGVAEGLDKTHKAAIKGMHELSGDQYYGLYKTMNDIAGHDGKKQTAPNGNSDNQVSDKPFAYAYTDEEEAMIKGADPKAKKITSSKSEEVKENEQKTVAKTWDQMTPQEKSSGVKGRTAWNEKTQRYYTLFDVPVKQETDEAASLATMRDFFAGDEKAKDPLEITKQRLYYDPKTVAGKRKEFKSPHEYQQWLARHNLTAMNKGNK